jgi:hypothetical protein
MEALKGITPEALRRAVLEDFLKKAVAAEEVVQERPLTKNEETAFRRGIKVGVNFDLFRDGDWEAAAESLRSKNRPGAQAG